MSAEQERAWRIRHLEDKTIKSIRASGEMWPGELHWNEVILARLKAGLPPHFPNPEA